MKIFSPGIHVKTASLSQELLYQLCGGGHAVFAQQAGLVCPTSACVRQIGVKTRWRHRRNLDDEVRYACTCRPNYHPKAQVSKLLICLICETNSNESLLKPAASIPKTFDRVDRCGGVARAAVLGHQFRTSSQVCKSHQGARRSRSFGRDQA